MEKSKNYKCGSVCYCERISLMGLCTSKYDCENQLPIEVSLTVPGNAKQQVQPDGAPSFGTGYRREE
jgi:hypothetical protein